MTEFSDGEVKLVVEAFSLPENPMLDGDKVGETVFLVYPRTTSMFPMGKAETPPSEGETEVYSFETQLVLTQVLEGEGISVNAAVLKVLVSLIKKDDTPEESSKPEKSKLKFTVHKVFCKTLVQLFLAVSEAYRVKNKVLLCSPDFNYCSPANYILFLLCPVGESQTETDFSSDRCVEIFSGETVEEDINVDGLPQKTSEEHRSGARKSNSELSQSFISLESLCRQQQAGSLANFCPSFEEIYGSNRSPESIEIRQTADKQIERQESQLEKPDVNGTERSTRSLQEDAVQHDVWLDQSPIKPTFVRISAEHASPVKSIETENAAKPRQTKVCSPVKPKTLRISAGHASPVKSVEVEQARPRQTKDGHDDKDDQISSIYVTERKKHRQVEEAMEAVVRRGSDQHQEQVKGLVVTIIRTLQNTKWPAF